MILNLASKIKDLFSFSLIGGVVTISSLIISYFFLAVLKTPLYITYIGIYSSMILLSYIFNARFTFKVFYSYIGLVKYILVYLSGMIVGLLTLKIYKTILLFDNWILSYLAIPVTLLWNFILSSIYLKDNKINE